MSRPKLDVTELERHVIWAFLRAPELPPESYMGQSPSQRTRGIPTGVPLAGLLTNIALLDFDAILAEVSGFALRTGDDFLVFSPRMQSLQLLLTKLSAGAQSVGAQLNRAKQSVTTFGAGDLIECGGYRIDRSGQLSMAEGPLHEIEKSVLKTIAAHGSTGSLSPVIRHQACLTDLRRIVYGQNRGPNAFGALAFFPLMNELDQLRGLDGLVHDRLRRAFPELWQDTGSPSFVGAWRRMQQARLHRPLYAWRAW